jgi:hypothetical protein
METNKDFICINAWIVIIETTAIIFLLCWMCMLLWVHVFDTQDDLWKLEKTHAAVVKELSELKQAQIVLSPPRPTTTTTTTTTPTTTTPTTTTTTTTPPPPTTTTTTTTRPDLDPPSYCEIDRLSAGIFGQSRPTSPPPYVRRDTWNQQQQQQI